MAGLKGITINTAPEAEPHIYAEDDAAIFQTIFGEDGVSNVGQACKATVLSNNKVRIADGVLFVGGHFARIPYGEYVDCEIANGQSGKNRNDIIVAKFVTTGTGGIDKMTCEVKQGEPGAEATDPEIIQSNLYQGGKVREFPLYRVKIEGLSITEVEQLFKVTPTNKGLTDKVTELNGKLQDIGGMHFKAFSFVGNPKGSSSFKLFALADIKSKYFPNATHQNCGCLCMNGDGVASGAHYEGTTWNGTDLYVVFSSQVNTQIRFTGLLYYCDSDLIGG